jgi:hypothetical protein
MKFISQIPFSFNHFVQPNYGLALVSTNETFQTSSSFILKHQHTY